jgi:hypothetical protein
MAEAKTRLLFSVLNNAWIFVFGRDPSCMSVLRMGDHDTFFTSRKDAVAAAKAQGLKVSRRGVVSCDSP